ncbi:MAG: aspartate/glutamate racemase family protein [Chloroflexi bacterium]|nr:aspartate/glutamate racemase family protein [Chloroflexota bacterium]
MRTEESVDGLRIGLIVPSSNTIVEADFARSLPPGVTFHTARMFLAETTAEAERRMVTEYVPRSVADLASLYPRVVVFACTSGGAVLGAEGEARLMDEIAEATRARAVSTNNAVGTCIARLNPRRVAVITPYIDDLNARIRQGLERHGLVVAHIAGLGITDNFALALVPPARIIAFAEEALAGVDFDLLFVSCTNFRGMEARPTLARRFGVPVVTSNQATIDAALEALGLPARSP